MKKIERYWISEAGYQKLEEKYDRLLQEEIDIQKQIGESVKMDNDLRENPDYMSLQSKAMSEMKFHLAKTKAVLAACDIIEQSERYLNDDDSDVYIGSKVSLRYEDGAREEYTILGYDEGDLETDVISYLSPLGSALLERKMGQTFRFKNGDYEEEITILRIQKGGRER